MGAGSRKAALVGGAVLSVVAGLGYGLVARDDSPETRILTRSNPPVDTPPAPVAVPTPEPSGDDPPATAVALSATGEVALLDTRLGKPVRVLATHGSDALQGLSVAPDRRHAYYATTTLGDACWAGTLHRVALDGRSPVQPLGAGISPAVSPDGRLLAYAGRGANGCHNVIVVRDLATEVERSWRHPDDPGDGVIYELGAFSKLAWAPDSRRLAYSLSYEGESVAVLDTLTQTDLSETTEVVIHGGGGDSRHPAWQASTGRLVVVNSAFSCCYEDDYTGPVRTLAVDLPNRRPHEVLGPGVRPSWLDFDTTGRHLLYVDEGRLLRRHGRARPVEVAEGYIAADW